MGGATAREYGWRRAVREEGSEAIARGTARGRDPRGARGRGGRLRRAGAHRARSGEAEDVAVADRGVDVDGVACTVAADRHLAGRTVVRRRECRDDAALGVHRCPSDGIRVQLPCT